MHKQEYKLITGFADAIGTELATAAQEGWHVTHMNSALSVSNYNPQPRLLFGIMLARDVEGQDDVKVVG